MKDSTSVVFAIQILLDASAKEALSAPFSNCWTISLKTTVLFKSSGNYLSFHRTCFIGDDPFCSQAVLSIVSHFVN